MQSLAIGPNGTLYFSNYPNNSVYAVTVNSAATTQSSQLSARTMSVEAAPSRSMLMAAAVANSSPTASPSMGTPNTSTGVSVGNVNAVDTESNPLTYSVAGQPTRGTVNIDSSGTITYTPTQAERVRAGQTTGADQDSFTITVSDGQGGTAPVTVQVASWTPPLAVLALETGAVIGNVNITDWDGDPLTYATVTAPAKGSVSFNPTTGTYTYTPTPAARDTAVQNPGLTDTFTVRATDPYGAYLNTASITVPILPTANHAPTAPSYQYFDPTDPVTGEVHGRVVASDADADPLSYQVVSGPWSASSFTFNSTTSEFSYVPSQEQREYVTQWPGYDDYDYFQVVVSDGAASVNTSVNVLVSPIQMAPTAYYPPEVGQPIPPRAECRGR
jgi:VCBS repeat-containing protein